MKRLRNLLTALFNIRPGEEKPTALLLLHSFFMGVSLVVFETAAYALFLDRFDAKSLPYVYIISAVFIALCGYLYGRLEERLPFAKGLILTLAAMFLSIALFYLVLQATASRWVLMALVVWHNVMLAMVGLEFWGLAGRLLNVRQGKRLFGLIGVGEIVAGIISGFSIPILVGLMGTRQLFLLSAAGMGACLLVLIAITRAFSPQLTRQEPTGRREEKDQPSELPRSRYLTLVLSFAALAVFGYYLLDYVFYGQVDAAYRTEAQIASFLGLFYGVLGVVNLISNAFLPGRVITRYGMSIGLLLVPATVILGSGIAAAMGWAGALGAFFWVVAGTKLLDEVFRVSIEEPSLRILYQPFPVGQRIKAQTVLETRVEPLAGAVAGGLLLLFDVVFPLSPVHVILLVLLICGGWIAVSLVLRREYTAVLMRALTKRKLGGRALSLEDSASESVLRRGLSSQTPGVVIYCLEVLEEIEHEKLPAYLQNLLDHQAPEVRKYVLERIGALGMAGALPAVVERLRAEPSPPVLGTALRTLCAVSETEAFEKVFPYLDSPDPELRKGAMVGLLSHGGIDGVLSAGGNLNALLASEESADRMLAAHVLGEVGISGFYRPLLKLLQDPDMDVRRAAVVASGNLKSPRLLPPLLESFRNPELRSAAVHAVVDFGREILPELEEAFDAEETPTETRGRIIRIMARIGGARAVAILKKKIDASDEDIRNRILAGLVQCRYQAAGKEIGALHKRIRNEVKDATWTLSALLDIGDYKIAGPLVQALKGEVERNRRRIFLMLAMIYNADAILSAQADIASADRNKRDRAIEAMDNLISTDIKGLVLPLLDDLPTSQRHARLIHHFEQERLNRHERLKEILSRSHQWTSAWTKACALFAVGRIGTMEFYDAVVSCLSDPDPTVRETAVWALGCLNPNDLVERLQPLTGDRSAAVVEFARFVINSVGFASIPMGKGYLTRSGRYTVDLFKNILLDDGERRARRCRAANILARFQGTAARAALLEGLTVPDKTIRTAVLDALIKGRFTIEGSIREELRKLLSIEIGDAKQVVSAMVTFLPERRADRLVRALNGELVRSRRRILSILALLTPEDVDLSTIFFWYIHQDEKPVPKAVTGMLRTLLSEIPDPKLGDRIFTLFHHRDFSRMTVTSPELRAFHTRERVVSTVKQIAFGASVFTLSWSRICALELIVRLDLVECVPQITEKVRDIDDIVRATSAWALFQLDPETYEDYAPKLAGDPSALVSRTVRQLEEEKADTGQRAAPAAKAPPHLKLVTS